MAKRRILKKEIGVAAGDLFLETLFCKLYVPGTDPEKADVLMARILDMQDNFISRVSHPDGKNANKRVQAYFGKLREDLQNEVDAIAAEIGKLN